MRKKMLVFVFVLFASFFVSPNVLAKDASAVSSTQVPNFQINIVPQNTACCRAFYGPTVISSGVNYIDRDMSTGEIKQVVQVAPPPSYYRRVYY